jgi:hypothetical protein
LPISSRVFLSASSVSFKSSLLMTRTSTSELQSSQQVYRRMQPTFLGLEDQYPEAKSLAPEPNSRRPTAESCYTVVSPGRGWALPGVWLPRQKDRQDEDNDRRHKPPIDGNRNDDTHPGRFLAHSSSPPLRWHGPQVARHGLRTDGSLFRADLPPPLPHTQEKCIESTPSPSPGVRSPSQLLLRSSRSFRIDHYSGATDRFPQPGLH